jgi:site-specific DNA-methyltransferase (adenine-specific)
VFDLQLGDNVELTSRLESNSIDLTVTSPPYDKLRKYGSDCQWDFDGIVKQLYRVTKQGGVVVWVVGDATVNGSETGTSFRQALYFMEVGFNLHDTMIWRKTNPMPHVQQNRFTPAFEYMFVFSRGTPKTANIITEPSKHAGKILGTTNTNKESIKRAKSNQVPVKPTKLCSNVRDYMVAGTNFGHPAIFPLQLAYDHVYSWSNKGDTVLDPFMGSGTVGVACRQLERDFIGYEIKSEYLEIAKGRIGGDETVKKNGVKEEE